MTILRLIRRNAFYFRAANAAVVAGIAVATAVLSGALMVGDSVRQSLRDLAALRLGKIDQALIAPRFFDASVADRLAADLRQAAPRGRFDVEPAIITRGSTAADTRDEWTPGVQIIGAAGDWVTVKTGGCILNGQTAESLDLQSAGGTVALSVPTETDMPPDATLAHRSRQDVLSGLRAIVLSIVTEPGMISLFSPAGGQRTPQNAWVNLADLQDAIGQSDRINTLFIHDSAPASDATAQLNASLNRIITLADYGLKISPASNQTQTVLSSTSIYLDPPVESAADQTARDMGISLDKITVGLVNSVNRISSDGSVASSIHYAVAAGITPLNEHPLADDEVALNQWAAARLHAKRGDRISLTFFIRRPDGNLAETNDQAAGFPDHFRVARILPMKGIGADPSLTPTYKGLTDADSVADWNPPQGVHIDKTLVTKADETYWKLHKAAPKIFLSYSSAQRLWSTSVGHATSLRLPADRGDEFAAQLLRHLNPAAMGMAFRPLRDQQLAAANGTVDFGQLFLSFSFFLIFAAVLMVAMFLRLSIQQRARQLGVMSAVGFSTRALRKIMMCEQMTLALAGGIIGSLAAIAYTWLMMAGLRTWWVGAVGTTQLHLHIVPMTLAFGFLGGQFVALLTIWWAVAQMGRLAPARLLAGGWEAARFGRGGNGRISSLLAIVNLLGGTAIIVAGSLGRIRPQEAFLAGGALLLASCLCGLTAALRKDRRRPPGAAAVRSLPRLGIRNATRHPARSVLCVGLIALAAYALVTVAAMRQGEPTDTGDTHSGSGGFRLILQAEIPLLGDPATVQGRELLGFRDPANPIWDRVQFISMRRRAGQDVSCLNLTQPTDPTILAIPDSLAQRNGFSFADVPTSQSNPWKLLQQTGFSDDIPIFADDSTAQYILHIAPGQTLEISDAAGAPHRLRLAATLAGSIFQSELLMSEDNFRKIFPAQNGFGTVLIAASPADQDQVRHLLRDELGEYGVSVQTTASVLADYLQVQNTYLSTFEVLGALGLMLGTIGLAVVLVRTVIERKAELALLASIGFGTGKRIGLVLTENIFLLFAGMFVGTICALVGVLPALVVSAREINIPSLAMILAAALAIGLCASGVAVMLSGMYVTPADLRRE